ncbi:MAG TPA: hypothetical protein VKV74_02715 [Bryobacteraceae bacterium]|nr:hypothetical protein [Bryobacteraceae bacterium]
MRIYCEWNAPLLSRRFSAGVSLHSHTLHSKENLGILYRAARHWPLLQAAIRKGECRYREVHGAELDLTRAWWTPPLGPHQAWRLEAAQLEGLNLHPLVSLTDHDDIEAPVSLQVLEECHGSPISVEWTVPFQNTFFHLGVHNLPPSSARGFFQEMDAFRRAPRESCLGEILEALAKSPGVLIVFNHPLWDELGIGQQAHRFAAAEFLARFGRRLHALELNGMRCWRENRAVIDLAEAAAKPAVSGGDRHIVEPNALVNLTHARSFSEFAEEIRAGFSEVLILRHYRESYALRIFHNLLDALKNYDDHANGWTRWSDRVFHQLDNGRVRSLSELFEAGLPVPVDVFLTLARFASAPHFRRLLRSGVFGLEEIQL